jgi:hypothetical protein
MLSTLLVLLLLTILFITVDEAQSVKNAESIRHKFLTKFNSGIKQHHHCTRCHLQRHLHTDQQHLLDVLCSERRLLLTGTPLQNNIAELWALLEFLMPEIFARFRKKNEVNSIGTTVVWFDNATIV